MPKVIKEENGEQTVEISTHDVESLKFGAFKENVLIAAFVNEDDAEFFIRERISCKNT